MDVCSGLSVPADSYFCGDGYFDDDDDDDNTTQHNTTQHNTTQHNTTQHNTTQHWVYYFILLILFWPF